MSYEFSQPQLPAGGWLSSLKPDDREIFSSYGEFLPAHPHKPIIVEGEPQPYLYFIISGTFLVWKMKDGQQHHVATLHPGDSLGEMSIFDLDHASATVAPNEFGQVWRINYEEFMRFVHDNQGAAVKILLSLLVLLTKRLRKA